MVKIIPQDSILIRGNTFLPNPYDEKYLLIGNFNTIDSTNAMKYTKVLTHDGWGLMNEKGREVIKPHFLDISTFSNGISVVVTPNEDKRSMRSYPGCHSLIHYQKGMLTTKCYQTFRKEDTGDESSSLVFNPHQHHFSIVDGDSVKVYNLNGQQIIRKSYGKVYDAYPYLITRDKRTNYFIMQNHYLYDFNGNLLKTLFCYDVKFQKGFFIVQDDKGYKILKSNNLTSVIQHPITKIKEWEGKNHLFSGDLKIQDKDYKFFLSKDLNLTLIDYNSTEDKFIVYDDFMVKENKRDEIFSIYDLNARYKTKYNEQDYKLMSKFAYGKIFDSTFIDQKRKKWNEMTAKDQLGNIWSKGISTIKRGNYYEALANKDLATLYVYDNDSGQNLFELPGGYYFLYALSPEKLVFKKDDAVFIFNRKGKLLKELSAKQDIYNNTLWKSNLNENVNQGLSYRIGKSFISDSNAKKSYFINNNFKKTGDEYDEIRPQIPCYTLYKNEILGIADVNGKIIKEVKYTDIKYLNDGVVILYEPNGNIEWFSPHNMKSHYQLKVKPQFNDNVRLEKDFVHIFNSTAYGIFLIDRYGNIVFLPHNNFTL